MGAALTAAVADDTERRAAHELDRVTITQLGAIAGASRDALQPRLVARVAESVGQVIFTEHPEVAEADARLHANFIAAGTVQVLLDWIERGGVDEERLIEQIAYLIPAWMKSATQ